MRPNTKAGAPGWVARLPWRVCPLIINTGTTIATFLMVFLIQNTQNRDMSVLHLKLDELIRVTRQRLRWSSSSSRSLLGSVDK
jgi:hypothetical protein